MSLVKEFKEFAVKGNMVDMAVGIIIGAAFTAIVSSLVGDIFMPIIGLLLGGLDFTNMFIVLSNPEGIAVPSLAVAQEAGIATINIGLFINATVKFVIVAFVVFMLVKGINSLRRKQAAEPVPEVPPAPPREELLLIEIRDILKTRT